MGEFFDNDGLYILGGYVYYELGIVLVNRVIVVSKIVFIYDFGVYRLVVGIDIV